MKVLGVDLSLTAVGIAEPDSALQTFKPASWSKGMARLLVIRRAILDFCDHWGVEVVAIEGYAYGKGNGAHQLGEVGGVVRLELFESEIPYVDIPPASLKRYATGKGNANKDAVMVAAVKRLDVTPANNNESDAAWLRAMALDAAGEPLVAMPATHRTALKGVAWPGLDEPGWEAEWPGLVGLR